MNNMPTPFINLFYEVKEVFMIHSDYPFSNFCIKTSQGLAFRKTVKYESVVIVLGKLEPL